MDAIELHSDHWLVKYTSIMDRKPENHNLEHALAGIPRDANDAACCS